MAALTFQATANPERSHDVVRSTDDAIGSAVAALIIDNTATKLDVMDGYKALGRALSRAFGTDSSPADIATTGTTVE